VLLGHIDTVPGEIPVRIEGDVLHGRGSVDAKGPLAAFVMAAAQALPRPGTRLVVIGAVEEESASSKGARLAVTEHQPDYCIIGEPSGWQGVTLGYKGRILFDYELDLAVEHTAGPGTSAGERAIAWWNHLIEYATGYNKNRPRLFDQLLPSLRGINTSSDGFTEKAFLKAGLRLPPDFETESFTQEAKRWAGEAGLHSYGYEPAFQAPRTTTLARAFNQSIRELGDKPRYKLKTGTSDMNVVGPHWNCPIVAYGPGDSRLDHTPKERLSLQEYLKSIQVLRRVLEAL
jgi:LysW-gamma-L-lysine carboxypeptidase